MELCDKSATELGALLKRREITSRAITESVLARMDQQEPAVNAYVTQTRELARQQADAADARWQQGKPLSPIDGIPVSLKDNLCTQGIRTTCGSKILENYIPPYDATAVAKIKHAGAVLIGKTNLDEFGMGSSTEKSIHGPTRNPLNPAYVPGGSSGGSAASVAAGESILSLGTDTGGSVRMPAAYCGVVGIKPTYGRVSRYGLISYASSLDQIGVLGRTVADCALLLNVIAGHDPRDSTSADVAAPDFTAALENDLAGVRIGLPREYFVTGLNSQMKEKILAAVKLMEASGAQIVDISLPHTRYAVSAYYLIATAEASSNLARYDGVKYGFRPNAELADAIQLYETTRSQGFGAEVKRRIMLGSYVLSAGYYDAYYLKAQKVRTLIKNDFDVALQRVDCILTPVTPSTPFKIGEKNDDPLQMYLEDIYTVSLNLAGLPGMSVNCGMIDGLPAAFQLIGKAFDEAMILRVGNAFEGVRA
jgi:aspartyl-tRNA(Asn)/glutamyl-tRNA(Gln) amidotransferase subunit A